MLLALKLVSVLASDAVCVSSCGLHARCPACSWDVKDWLVGQSLSSVESQTCLRTCTRSNHKSCVLNSGH